MSLLKPETTKTYHVIVGEVSWNIVANSVKLDFMNNGTIDLVLLDEKDVEIGRFKTFVGYYYDYS